MLTADEAISNDLVLQAAWRRVEAWYRGGGLAPEPELSRWRLHPEAELRKLSSKLREGSWQPRPWQQVPYPKKKGCLRHYVVPTVRDQVAFMAHLVLLGPLLDVQLHSFAFGNRWYRPVLWDRRRGQPMWVERPYPFASGRTYLPYSRSHGLFRRVAHWTVAQMTKAQIRKEDYAGRVQHIEDYAAESLPPWTRPEWWGGTDGDQAYWAALDIEMAYPSVRLERLRSALDRMVGDDCPGAQGVIQGCPESTMEALGQIGVRQGMVELLIAALQSVNIEPGPIPPSAWGLPEGHWLPDLNRDGDGGLPTGLAVSGMLLNVALHEADTSVKQYLDSTIGGMRGALVRFADDMYVMSKSREGILELVEVVDAALASSDRGGLASPNDGSNLCLNVSKIRPDAVQTVVKSFLVANDWEPCDECGVPVPPKLETQDPHTILEWWANLEDDPKSQLRTTLDRTAVAKGDVGPFVTALVERLSELGTDTLDERFDDGARSHIARLHELARFNIDDEQVRPETRRTFSVNRLVGAWAPADMEWQVVRDIRETVASVLAATPWQFNLWRAVVRASVRRPASVDRASDREAEDWLCVQLRRIAMRPDSTDLLAWENVWPEDLPEKGGSEKREQQTAFGVCKLPGHVREGWRSHYLSFHRAAFWRAVSEALRELGRHEYRYGNERDEREDREDPSPNVWTARAVPEGGHRVVADWLAALDRWAEVLYSGGDRTNLRKWPWEAEALAGAVLSAQRTSTIAEAWRRTSSPASVRLRVPATEDVLRLVLCADLLRDLGRLVRVRPDPIRRLRAKALAHVRFGQPDRSLSRVLFPRDAPSRVRGRTLDER
ncbi:MAG: hypothetical protein OXG36_13795, partial [Caldilineaceae bacterium]|nr:hypothetical protein [Caldilineaceae bacterium]